MGGNLIEEWIFEPGMAYFKIVWGGKSVWGGKAISAFHGGGVYHFRDQKMIIYFIFSYFSYFIFFLLLLIYNGL